MGVTVPYGQIYTKQYRQAVNLFGQRLGNSGEQALLTELHILLQAALLLIHTLQE